jgi:4-amino-4-deoxy-L-arabinose transferase-like glycosyltransferase
MNNKFSGYFKYIVLAALIYMPVFGFLDRLPIRVWDESRLAINAYEMYKSGDYVVMQYAGEPDLWNTKPPLMIWLQVFFMKMLGVNELAIRLPSAIACFFTCVGIMLLAVRYLKDFWFGFIAILVLLTCNGYVSIHGTRTGDFDALLTAFTTLAGLSFFAFCERGKTKYLYYFFAFTILGVYTKSVAGVIFFPALLIYCIIRKQLIPLLKNKHLYFGLLGFIVLVGSFYWIREMRSPGYLAAVQKNELGSRYLETLEDHKQPFMYYYNNFINFQINSWYLLIPCGILIGFLVKNEKLKRLTLFSTLMIIVFFMIISTAQTKLEWYDIPLYPFLAIVIAVFIYYIFDLLRNISGINQTLTKNAIPFIFLFLILIGPYQKIIYKTYKPVENSWEKDGYELGYFLQDAVKGRVNVDNYYLLYAGHNPHNWFYLHILNDKGIKISFKNWTELKTSDLVIAQQADVKKYIDEHYQKEIMYTRGGVVAYRILSAPGSN